MEEPVKKAPAPRPQINRCERCGQNQVEHTCEWCDFRTVCGSTEWRRVSRKLTARGRVAEANGRLLADLTELRRFP